MDNTHYNPFGTGGWIYGEKLPGRDEWHSYLGPCPKCGTACFNYGGGWRCMAMYCSNNASNPISSVGPAPAWWNTNIQVKKDGNAWCAIEEGNTATGDTPQGAVNNLKLVSA